MSRPFAVIFSDLDGTLLDHHTYSFEPALPVLRLCRTAGVPVVLCSSKTRAEIERLRRQMRSTDPFIVENGGAVHLPGRVVELGVRYSELCATLDRLSRELSVPVEAFHHLTPDQIALRTGLPPGDAADAAAREYDEPFTFLGDPDPRLLTALESAGLRWTCGGRFYHVLGHPGKDAAVRTVLAEYRAAHRDVVSAGLGDSPNDLPLFSEVDIPILVQRPDGAYDREVLARLPGVRRAPAPGPAGWNLAVAELLGEWGYGQSTTDARAR